MAANYIDSFDPTAGALTYQFVNQTSTVSTSSSTYATTGLTLTVLETGSYMVLTSAYMTNSGGVGLDREGVVSVFVDGVASTSSTSGAGCLLSGVSLANNGFDATVGNLTVLPLTAGNVLDLRFAKLSGGDGLTITNRSMIIIKVA